MLLRDYQLECIERVLASFSCNQSGKELMVLPTGAGKTVIFSHITLSLARDYGLITLIVAHRDELLDQAADKYLKINPTAIIGKVGSGVHQYGGEVTVASIATISLPSHLKKIKALYGTGKGLLIIVDEAHHSESASYQRVLEALPDAFVLLATATPDRLDGKPLLGGKTPLYSASIIDMIQRGYLCNIKAIAIRTEVNLDDLHSRAGDFSQEELDLAVNTPARNKRVVDAYQEHCSGQRAICFAVTVAHAEALTYAFNDTGIASAVVTGTTPIEERKKLYKALHDGELLVLCNVQVLTEGFDEPLVECVIMARPTQSRSLYVQAIGRGLRLAEGKPHCTILDLTDNCLKHRLMPQSLGKAMKLNVESDETITEALARVEQEEKEAMVRKLTEKRVRDIHINLLEVLEWQELPNGNFVVEVGRAKHRIALLPTLKDPDLFEVWARLSPNAQGAKSQKWMGPQSLEVAQQFAEKRIKTLHDDPTKKKWLDKNEEWRDRPITDPQKQMLAWKGIEWNAEMTSGDASDLIDQQDVKKIQERVSKAELKAAKKKQAEAYA